MRRKLQMPAHGRRERAWKMPGCPPSLGCASAGKPGAAAGQLCCGAVTAPSCQQGVSSTSCHTEVPLLPTGDFYFLFFFKDRISLMWADREAGEESHSQPELLSHWMVKAAPPAPRGCPSLASSLGVPGQPWGRRAGSHPNFQPCVRLPVKVRLRRLQRDMKWEGRPQRGAARAPAVRRAGRWQNRIWLCSERCF